MPRHTIFMAALMCGFLLVGPAFSQGTPQTTASVVSSCGSASYTTGQARPVTQDPTGKACTSASVTPSGTQDTNLKQVNGATVNVGAGAAGTGTQRVTTSTDSTIGTVTTITNPVTVTGSVTTSTAVGITPTDRTITSATGSSQTLMALNASRHSVTIVNTGSANCGINPTGGTAAIGGAGTLTLYPGGAYTPRIPTLNAITAICTAAQPLYADEN